MYIRSEDLGVQYIGPFPSREAAQAHMDQHFPAYRKEQSGYKDQIVEFPSGGSFISPEQDAAMWAEEAEDLKSLPITPRVQAALDGVKRLDLDDLLQVYELIANNSGCDAIATRAICELLDATVDPEGEES